MHDHKRQSVYISELGQALPAFAGKRVLIAGDIMLDHFVVGQVERISPEAPVPVVCVEEENYRLGGAGNVALNVKGLGGDPLLLGIRGDDANGAVLSDLLRKSDIDSRVTIVDGRPTTRKIRIIAHNQQVVRVDYEDSGEVSGDVLYGFMEALRDSLEGIEVLVLSDYGKGLVTGGFMKALRGLLGDMDRPPAVLVDPKVRNFMLYEGVDLLTPNANEAAQGSGIPAKDREGVLKAGIEIFKRLRCKHLLITLGPEGMAFFQGPDSVWRIPTSARKVFDVTGAGDTVIATVGLGLASGMDMLRACALANYAAGVVVGEVGTVAVSSAKLADALASEDEAVMDNWL